MTIRDFVRTVWSGKYYVIAAVLVVVAVAMYYVQSQDTQYRATATVQIYDVHTAAGTDVTVATTADDVTSPTVVEAATATLDPGPAGAPTPRVAAEIDPDARTVAVHATSTDAVSSVRFANAFAAAYAAELEQIKAAQIAELDDRHEALAKQLTGVRGRLKADAANPLAIAEQEVIVAEYTALAIEANALRSLAVPGEVVRPAAGAEALGLSRATVFGIAVLAGLLAGVGLAFARRGLDVRVRTAGAAARIAGAPVLAELFGTRAAEREFARTHTLPVSRKTATPFTESIRELRTAVQVPLAGQEHAVVVITAADPSAPRAFIAGNLAASFALSGRRTVAVSGDLRRPQLDTMLAPPEGWSADDRGLLPTSVPNLRVMPVTDEEMDPADFLATTRTRALIAALREEAEVVVIDAPPVLAAADATILGGYAHGVVLVASAGRTNGAVLAAAAERLRLGNVPLFGVALTGVKGDRRMAYASTYGVDSEPDETTSVDAVEPETPTTDPETSTTDSEPAAADSEPVRVGGSDPAPADVEPTSDAERTRRAQRTFSRSRRAPALRS